MQRVSVFLASATLSLTVIAKLYPYGFPLFAIILLLFIIIALIELKKHNILLLLKKLKHQVVTNKNKQLLLFLIISIFIYYLISAIFSGVKNILIMVEIINYLEIMVLFGLIYLLQLSNKDFVQDVKQSLIKILSIAGILIAIYSLYRFISFYSLSNELSEITAKYLSTTSLIRDYNLFSLSLFACGLCLLEFTKTIKKPYLYIIAHSSMFVFYLSLYFNSSRRGMIILIVLLSLQILLLILKFIKTKRIKNLILASSIITGVIFTNYFTYGYIHYLSSTDKQLVSQHYSFNLSQIKHHFTHIHWRHLQIFQGKSDINLLRKKFNDFPKFEHQDVAQFYAVFFSTLKVIDLFRFEFDPIESSLEAMAPSNDTVTNILPEEFSPDIYSRAVRIKYSFFLFKQASFIKKFLGDGFKYLLKFGEKFPSKKNNYSYPHNVYLSSLHYSGILGLILLCVFTITSFYYCVVYFKLGYFTLFFIVSHFYILTSFNTVFSSKMIFIVLLIPLYKNFILSKSSRPQAEHHSPA